MQDLHSHYQYAVVSTKKLNFVGPAHEQLPYPLWDPTIWSNPRQLGPAQMHKLVYVATDQHNQQQASQQQSSMAGMYTMHGLQLLLLPELLSSPDQAVAGRWQQVQMEYLSSSAGWLTMRFLMLPIQEQLNHAPASYVFGPAPMPDSARKQSSSCIVLTLCMSLGHLLLMGMPDLTTSWSW